MSRERTIERTTGPTTGRCGAWRRRATALVTLGMLGAVAMCGPALAASTGSSTDGPLGQVPLVGRALTSSPLYVDPDMAWLFTPEQTSQLRQALRTAAVPVYILALPFDTDDDSGDYASYFVDHLYQQTHVKGVYLVLGPSGMITDIEYYVPRDIDLPVSVETGPDSDITSATIAANTAERLLVLVRDIDQSPVDPSAAGPAQALYTPGEFSTQDASPSTGSGGLSSFLVAGVLSLLFLGPLLAMTGLGLARAGRGYRANLRGWGDSGDPGTPVGRMPRSPSDDWLKRHARGELLALERAMAGQSDVNPGWQRACDDYDSGMLALNSAKEQIDLVGAIVLARDGRLALVWHTAELSRPCLVNPLHGRSIRIILANIAARPVQIPVCARCARAATRGQMNGADVRARMLRVEHDGTRTYYLEFDSVWRDKAFGPDQPQAVREHLGVS
jgi:hypothetical protein